MLAINLNVGDVVLEDGGDVDLASGNKSVYDSGRHGSSVDLKRIRYLDVVDAIGGSGDPGDLGGPIKGSVGEGGSYLREGTLGENTVRLVSNTNGKKKKKKRPKNSQRLEVILMSRYLHEQTGLTAGTIAYDNELASDLGHLE